MLMWRSLWPGSIAGLLLKIGEKDRSAQRAVEPTGPSDKAAMKLSRPELAVVTAEKMSKDGL